MTNTETVHSLYWKLGMFEVWTTYCHSNSFWYFKKKKMYVLQPV